MILSACGIAADSLCVLLGINLGCLAGRLNGRRPADILPATGRMRASFVSAVGLTVGYGLFLA
jgi:hypothetical protein